MPVGWGLRGEGKEFERGSVLYLDLRREQEIGFVYLRWGRETRESALRLSSQHSFLTGIDSGSVLRNQLNWNKWVNRWSCGSALPLWTCGRIGAWNQAKRIF